MCITVIYDSRVVAHDITRFKAAFTLNCTVAVISEDENSAPLTHAVIACM